MKSYLWQFCLNNPATNRWVSVLIENPGLGFGIFFCWCISILISSQVLSKVFRKFKIWPRIDRFFVTNKEKNETSEWKCLCNQWSVLIYIHVPLQIWHRRRRKRATWTHKKPICDYFTGPKKRKIGTALSWKKIIFDRLKSVALWSAKKKK
jgi:hypothetical protein